MSLSFSRLCRNYPVVLFITDSAPFTAQTYAELRGRLAQTVFVPVHNEAASFMLIAQDFPPSSPKYQTIHIPRLSRSCAGSSIGPGFPLLHTWPTSPAGRPKCTVGSLKIFGEFRELELQLLVGQLESSLRSSGKAEVRQIG